MGFIERVSHPLFSATATSFLFQEMYPLVGPIEKQISSLKKERPEVFEHSQRTKLITSELARYEGLSQEQIEKLEKAALLHDVGKIEISKETLNAPILTTGQKKELETHVRKGFDMIRPHDPETAAIIIGHHEIQPKRYPREKDRKGENPQIKHEQSLLALADQTDALLSTRPYKEPWTPEAAEIYLVDIFKDPKLVKVAVESRIEIPEIQSKKSA